MIDPDFARDEIWRLANRDFSTDPSALASEAGEEGLDRWDIDGAMVEAAESVGMDYSRFSKAVHAVAFPDRDDGSIADALACCLRVADEGVLRLAADGEVDTGRLVRKARKRRKRAARRSEYANGVDGTFGSSADGGGPSGAGDGGSMVMSAQDGEIDRLHKLSLQVNAKAFGSGRKAPRSSGKHSPSNPRQVGTASRAHAPDAEDLDPEVKRLRAELERLVRGRGHLYDRAVSENRPYGSVNSYPPHHGYPGTGRSGKPQTGVDWYDSDDCY